MNTAEQLAVLYERLRQNNWQRVNGNTWRSGTYTLHTAYVWGEATIEIRHDKQAKTFKARDTDWHRYYRGAEPLTWCSTDAVPVVKKVFVKVLDTGPDTV